MADDFGGASMEIFLALLALVMLLLLIGGLYLLRDRARGSSDQMSRSFLARYVRPHLPVCTYLGGCVLTQVYLYLLACLIHDNTGSCSLNPKP